MDRQLVIRPHGQSFHVAFHNYMGPFEGHQIGEWLGLQEIDPPVEDLGPAPLQEGQYYLWHAMDRHPDLHALVSAAQLGDVARAIDHFHVRVLKGKRFLPDTPAPAAPTEPPPSYIDLIEAEHRPFWTRGPRAILMTVLGWSIPTAIVVVAVLVLSRHVGDHRELVGVDEVFRRASLPQVQQSTLARLWDPDHSTELTTQMTSVSYIQGEQVVLTDGHVLEFRGLRDMRPVLERMRRSTRAGRINVDLVDGRVILEGIVVDGALTGAGSELVCTARLPRCADEPQRNAREGEGGWYQPGRLPLGDTPAMRALVDQRLSLSGVLVEQDGQLRLRCPDGEQFYVEPVRETPALREFLDLFTGSGTGLRLDVVLTEVFRATEQKETGVIGRLDLYSASAQNYHIVASR